MPVSQATPRHIFPEDLEGNTEYDNYILFIIKSWFVTEYASKGNPSGAHGVNQEKSVALHFPSNVQDETATSWNQEEMGLAGTAWDVFRNWNDFNQYKKFASELTDSAKFKAPEALGMASGLNMQNAAEFNSGETRNPRIRMLFENVQNRQFNFSFHMAPKSEGETQAIVNIIRSFREGQLPRMSRGGVSFTYPDVFYITMKSKGDMGDYHPIRFKPCILSNVSVDQSTEGMWAQFRNGFPVSVNMDLSFQEVEPLTREDYERMPFWS